MQADDGIRSYKVTGVQTCALPIYRPPLARTTVRREPNGDHAIPTRGETLFVSVLIVSRNCRSYRTPAFRVTPEPRSEERRVGEERRWESSRCAASGTRGRSMSDGR